jgi:glycosyltransferase involved in cell wall biosynthesis
MAERGPVQRAARRLVRTARRRLTGWEPEPGLPDTSWSTCEPSPDGADALEELRLFAVIGTWQEADIIDATVRNAFVQGCERVYLVDNESEDDTVAIAEAAGATLACRFHTDEYDEAERMRIMNDVVAAVSEEVAATDGACHIWWLWLDADEFPHGPRGMTVREYLAGLDRRFRVVGARFFNHYPDRVPEYVEGRHPLDYQPLCDEFTYPMCSRGHRKHPLQRWDREGPAITCLAGFHQASAPDTVLIEPAEPIFLHHFPFRVEAVSRRRLEMLVGDGGGRAAGDAKSNWHMHKRFRQLDAVYAHDWGAVEDLSPAGRHKGIRLQPWVRQVPAVDADFARF